MALPADQKLKAYSAATQTTCAILLTGRSGAASQPDRRCIVPPRTTPPVLTKSQLLPPVAPPVRDVSFTHPARRALVRPALTKRRHPDLTGFLAGAVVLMLTLFLVTAAGSHVQDRAAETVAQGMAMRGM